VTRDACLALESGQALTIFRECAWQDLDGDIASERRIAGTVHFAHSAR
jgi:hypothetical protein